MTGDDVRMYAKGAAMLAALVLLGTACGDEAGDAVTARADDPLVQAMVDQVLAETDGVTSDRAEAECLAGRLVGHIGHERLNILGVTETNIPPLEQVPWNEGEARLVVDELIDCVDVTGSTIDRMQLGELDDAQRACAEEVLNETAIKGLLLAIYTRDEAAPDRFFTLGQGIIVTCGIEPPAG